jgi:hypothetical protein
MIDRVHSRRQVLRSPPARPCLSLADHPSAASSITPAISDAARTQRSRKESGVSPALYIAAELLPSDNFLLVRAPTKFVRQRPQWPLLSTDVGGYNGAVGEDSNDFRLPGWNLIGQHLLFV